MLFSSTFDQPYGQFTSPDYPLAYEPAHGGCLLYTFTGPDDHIVELTLTVVELDATDTSVTFFFFLFFSFHPLFLSLWGRDPPVWGRDPPVWGRDPRSGVVTP